MILLVAAPFFAVVAVIIKATSAGPVFFRQVRTGRNEQPFSMMKFRTMYRDAESRRHELDHLNEVDGPLFKVQNDPRVTRVGRFLRRTSLDEFPQLINVWKGDMSLVGPRPFVVSEAMEIEGWARKRFEARPGMTGLWQVSGRNELSHLELCRLDYQYVASWSFWWDMQILWQTPSHHLPGPRRLLTRPPAPAESEARTGTRRRDPRRSQRTRPRPPRPASATEPVLENCRAWAVRESSAHAVVRHPIDGIGDEPRRGLVEEHPGASRPPWCRESHPIATPRWACRTTPLPPGSDRSPRRRRPPGPTMTRRATGGWRR